ncbi:MAG: leucyl aminopeptidase [Acidimicrobiales bacterium]|jgi:leucyl aminopeptidase|nr:leucyl aminopeptidase [Acidimicrobiales bacterium]MDP6299200.1 leucyl aminopeptidase [Acidimicrobiales bacterium]HJM27977.1 leucyl aminopeptidase [Acidimicrobiales bacterium]HJM97920.1 leucyl aminopeptidase [Acidimicrobiales bacterium]
MTIEIKLVTKKPVKTQLHALVTPSDKILDLPAGINKEFLESRGFDGEAGQILFTQLPEGPIALLGVGESENLEHRNYRQAGTKLLREVKNFRSVSVDFGGHFNKEVDQPSATQAFLEGALLGAYEFTQLKSKPKKSSLKTLAIVGSGQKVKKAISRAESIALGVNLARDMVNLPGGDLTPIAFSRKATAIAKEKKLSIKILDAAAIKKAKMGGILGVNRGSTQQPRFVQLSYKPQKPSGKHLVLVGKGVTFDAGGLSIKTAQGMSTMKCDMGGAAAVLGAMSTLNELAPSVRVTGLMPLTDNMLGGDATRPGDVLRIKNGKTVEVLNTDAEGRLILADALSVASAMKADAIIDLATLTGACMVALGNQYAGLMGTDSDLIEAIENSSKETGEEVWHLPLPKAYRSQLDSDVADVKNIGTNWGGALTAGLFLKEFISEETPWAHIDIAGPAFADSPWGEHPKGGTGFGVRLLVNVIENL